MPNTINYLSYRRGHRNDPARTHGHINEAILGQAVKIKIFFSEIFYFPFFRSNLKYIKKDIYTKTLIKS
jgi:hypothetical protein